MRTECHPSRRLGHWALCLLVHSPMGRFSTVIGLIKISFFGVYGASELSCSQGHPSTKESLYEVLESLKHGPNWSFMRVEIDCGSTMWLCCFTPCGVHKLFWALSGYPHSISTLGCRNEGRISKTNASAGAYVKTSSFGHRVFGSLGSRASEFRAWGLGLSIHPHIAPLKPLLLL